MGGDIVAQTTQAAVVDDTALLIALVLLVRPRRSLRAYQEILRVNWPYKHNQIVWTRVRTRPDRLAGDCQRHRRQFCQRNQNASQPNSRHSDEEVVPMREKDLDK